MAIISSVALLHVWGDISVLQRLLVLNFIVMQLHQFEEYAFPGGLPAAMNILQQKSADPRRWLLNQNATFWGCTITVYVFYFLPIFYPDQIWFGLGGALIGLSQILVHLPLLFRLRYWYAMGNVSVFLGHVPVGIYYIWYVTANGLVAPADWWIGAGIALFTGVGLVGVLGYKLLTDRNSPYPYDDEEVYKPWVMKRIAILQAAENSNFDPRNEKAGRNTAYYSIKTNRRHLGPLNSLGKFRRANHAPTLLPAAVAYLFC